MVQHPSDLYSQAEIFFSDYGIPLVTFTILTGILIGYIFHYIFNERPIQRAHESARALAEEETSVRGEKSRIKTNEEVREMLFNDGGSMNTASITTTGTRKNRVVFNPKVEERVEVAEDYSSESDEESIRVDPENEEEEQMPQISDRKVLSSTTRQFQLLNEDHPIDGDRINKTLGTLHGKLATAQLKAKTRQMAAEMTPEERDQEAMMKAKQMESIMRLMMQNKDKFGMSSEDDIQQQLNLYNF